MGILQPINIFLRQEIDRMQRVITRVRLDLKDLKLAIDGTIIMSENLRDALDNMFDARVPTTWKKVSFYVWPLLWCSFFVPSIYSSAGSVQDKRSGGCRFNSSRNNKSLRLIQIQSICIRQINRDSKMVTCAWKDRKHGGKRRKCWLPVFSPFYTHVEDGTYYGITRGGRLGGRAVSSSLSGAYLQNYSS